MEFEIEENESVSMAVVRAVSTVARTDPCSLPPLGKLLDPDALDALFEPEPEQSLHRGGHVSFVYDEYRVSIDNGEYLTVSPLDSRDGTRRAIDG